MTAYWARTAYLPGGFARDVRIEIADGRFAAIATGQLQGDALALPGLVLPGIANCHSHAFHRALRGRTHRGGGTFWTWRNAMYAVADQLDPDIYLALARATYAEMALAGVTAVGEFHYLHHGPGGVPYADPNAMGEALRVAAGQAGIRLTLLDTCYLAGGLGPDGHAPLTAQQTRFGDGDADGWAARAEMLRPDVNTVVAAAIHSVRAVPRDQLTTVAEAMPGAPLHAHLSEQPAENDTCRAYYGCTPTELLAAHSALGPRTSVVHATHLTSMDITTIGAGHSTACLCPTTERDLADGIGPAHELVAAGTRLSLGSDQHATIDLLAEAQALEMDQRLATLRRGWFTPEQLVDALTAHGSLGWPDAGRIDVGDRADLVAIRSDSVRSSGSAADQLVLAVTAADVHTVIRDGERVVEDGQHRLGDVGRLLADAIEPLWDNV